MTATYERYSGKPNRMAIRENARDEIGKDLITLSPRLTGFWNSGRITLVELTVGKRLSEESRRKWTDKLFDEYDKRFKR